MTAVYNLFDVESGNLVGSYESEEDARNVVRGAYKQYGDDGYRGLVLIRADEDGQVLIAEEDALARESEGGVLIRALPDEPRTETAGVRVVVHGSWKPLQPLHHLSFTGPKAPTDAACAGV